MGGRCITFQLFGHFPYLDFLTIQFAHLFAHLFTNFDCNLSILSTISRISIRILLNSQSIPSSVPLSWWIMYCVYHSTITSSHLWSVANSTPWSNAFASIFFALVSLLVVFRPTIIIPSQSRATTLVPPFLVATNHAASQFTLIMSFTSFLHFCSSRSVHRSHSTLVNITPFVLHVSSSGSLPQGWLFSI